MTTHIDEITIRSYKFTHKSKVEKKLKNMPQNIS